MKAITLPQTTWRDIIGALETAGGDADNARRVALMREQLDGSVTVKVGRGTVSLRAPKGGDLRDSLLGGAGLDLAGGTR